MSRNVKEKSYVIAAWRPKIRHPYCAQSDHPQTLKINLNNKSDKYSSLRRKLQSKFNFQEEIYGKCSDCNFREVKQEATEEWEETMPLPGDNIEGFAKDDADEFFIPIKAKSELRSVLGKISGQDVEAMWVKIRRGDSTHKLRVRVALEKNLDAEKEIHH
ncbi:hypothetical protein SLA2020_476530 [Shorea laevis]